MLSLHRPLTLSYRQNAQAGYSEQPFPDSWIATTSGAALGMLTDITTEIFLDRGIDGRDILWPLLFTQSNMWVVGRSGGETVTIKLVQWIRKQLIAP